MTNLQVVQVFIIAFELWIFRSLVWNALSWSKIVWNFIFHRKYVFSEKLVHLLVTIGQEMSFTRNIVCQIQKIKVFVASNVFFLWVANTFFLLKKYFQKIKSINKNFNEKLFFETKCKFKVFCRFDRRFEVAV